MRVGVFGHVGNLNLGDEALIAAVIQNVRRRRPNAVVVGFTGRPADTQERHGILAFPIRSTNGRPGAAPAPLGTGRPGATWTRLKELLKRMPFLPGFVRGARRVGRATLGVPRELGFLARAFRNLSGTDLLLVAGSGQLNDYWGGPWGFPFTLLKWSLLARATGTKVAFLSLGAGPLRTRLGKFFIKQTLRLADYRSYRDEDSRRCVVALQVPGEHPVVPDLVFSLDVDRPAPPPPPAPARRPVVAVNPMPFFDDTYYPESDARVFGAYVQTMAAFADWLVGRGYTVRFFATQLLVDHRVIDQVRTLMRRDPARDEERVIAERIASFEELVAVLDAVDCVVATRYHGTLFALIRRRPVLSIAYQRKSIELMRQMGQGEYAIDIGQLTLATLQERFLALERNAGEFVAAVGRRLPEVRAMLDAQYARTFTLAESIP